MGCRFDGRVVPPICVSALSSDDMVEAARRLGFYKWISKPFGNNVVLDAFYYVVYDIQPSEGYCA